MLRVGDLAPKRRLTHSSRKGPPPGQHVGSGPWEGIPCRDQARSRALPPPCRDRPTAGNPWGLEGGGVDCVTEARGFAKAAWKAGQPGSHVLEARAEPAAVGGLWRGARPTEKARGPRAAWALRPLSLGGGPGTPGVWRAPSIPLLRGPAPGLAATLPPASCPRPRPPPHPCTRTVPPRGPPRGPLPHPGPCGVPAPTDLGVPSQPQRSCGR